MRNPFRRREEEIRRLDSTSLPTWSDVSSGSVQFLAAGETRALGLIPVYAANRLLASTVSTLPLKTYRDVDGEKRPVAQAQLFRRLEEGGRLQPWLHQCMTSLGLRGNAYGQVLDRDGFGYPTQIEWLSPDAIRWEPDKGRWRVGDVLFPERDILHIPWFLLPGRKEGLSPISAFAATIHGGLAMTKYGADWFEAGGVPPGTFKNTQQTLTQQQADVIKVRLNQAIKTRQPLVYGSDWEFNAVAVPPEEAQFVQSQRLTATQIATIYGIPPEMIGGETGASMTYANVEQQQINFLMMTLRPWLVTLERAFSALLPDRQYVRFNGDAMIRADVKTRYEVYEISRRIGLRSLDELRALEDLPSLPNGQGQEYLPPPPPPPQVPPNPDDTEEDS